MRPPISPRTRPTLLALGAAGVIVGLLGLTPHRPAPDGPALAVSVAFPEAPERAWWHEYEEEEEELDRVAIDEYYPPPLVDPTTGLLKDALFDCPGMPGPPPRDWDERRWAPK